MSIVNWLGYAEASASRRHLQNFVKRTGSKLTIDIAKKYKTLFFPYQYFVTESYKNKF